ncbi:MAG: hypothetical protein ILO42_06925 [Clostridia bacterium]|nr:hypothetical protein [Clostridia bacterium]
MPVLRKNTLKALDGAWEEPGVLGTRIEISGNKLTILWRNAPVLETTFRIIGTECGTELKPKKRELAYRSDLRPYAEVTSLVLRGEELELTKHFPITGDDLTVLRKTDRSRYGSYDVADELLPELQGRWSDGSDYMAIVIKGDVFSLNGKAHRFHVLRPRGRDTGEYLIADVDPSVYGWDGFLRFTYCGGELRSLIQVCDAPSIPVTYRKLICNE